MNDLFRRTITHPILAIGSTILWGLVELVALQRSRRGSLRPGGRPGPAAGRAG